MKAAVVIVYARDGRSERRASHAEQTSTFSKVKHCAVSASQSEGPPAMLQILSGSFVALLRVQGFSEALEILWLYTNGSTARAIYIRDEKKRDGKSDRQDQ
jgi:hypothetical protein